MIVVAALSAFLASGSVVSPVVAPTPNAECLTYDDAYAAAPLMKVLGQAGVKVHLQDKALPCRQGQACPWVRGAYVVPGDVVLVSAPVNGFRCVYIGSRGRLTSGFVSDRALSFLNAHDDITPAWLIGRWSDGNDLIAISKKGGGLTASGDGIWPGRNFDGPPGPNVGSFEGSPTISGDTVTIVDGECHVEGRRRGPYLILSDNANCGGMNVRFMGIYVLGSSLKP